MKKTEVHKKSERKSNNMMDDADRQRLQSSGKKHIEELKKPLNYKWY